MLSTFLLKSDKFLKHCIPEAFRKVPEDYPEAKPEGKNQYAKHRIPEAIRKVPEDFPEAEPEGNVQLFDICPPPGSTKESNWCRQLSGRKTEAKRKLQLPKSAI